MERVKYTLAYEADTNPFWYTEYTEGNRTIASTPADFRAAIRSEYDTYKLHDRNIQPNNFWQTWHTSVYDLANRTLRLNIQEDYTKHYDFKLNDNAENTPDYSQSTSWYKIPEITKDVETFFIYPTEYMGYNEGDPDYAPFDNAEMRNGAAECYIWQATALRRLQQRIHAVL